MLMEWKVGRTQSLSSHSRLCIYWRWQAKSHTLYIAISPSFTLFTKCLELNYRAQACMGSDSLTCRAMQHRAWKPEFKSSCLTFGLMSCHVYLLMPSSNLVLLEPETPPALLGEFLSSTLEAAQSWACLSPCELDWVGLGWVGLGWAEMWAYMDKQGDKRNSDSRAAGGLPFIFLDCNTIKSLSREMFTNGRTLSIHVKC